MTEHEDPIVSEVHETRAKLLEEHGGADGYAAHLREVEARVKDRVVTRPPRAPAQAGRKVS